MAPDPEVQVTVPRTGEAVPSATIKILWFNKCRECEEDRAIQPERRQYRGWPTNKADMQSNIKNNKKGVQRLFQGADPRPIDHHHENDDGKHARRSETATQ